MTAYIHSNAYFDVTIELAALSCLLVFTKVNLEQLATTLRERRKALKLQQVDLAELASVAVHTVSNLESGKGNPTLGVVSRVLDALGLELQVAPRSPR